MTYTTLISTDELALHLNDPDWAIFDCRFALADPERGRRDYRQAHIPGALYAHLNEDLSSPIVPGVTGRHPLPTVEVAAQKFARWGIDDRVQVVVYDDSGGGIAARLWWMLRWLGHEAAAVLDGDWRKWLNEGRAISSRAESRPVRSFVPRPRADLLMTTDEVEASLRGGPPGWRGAHPSTPSSTHFVRSESAQDMTEQSRSTQESASQAPLAMTPNFKLVDSRTADRYRGESETIDPIAGHIPGAISAPYPDNLNPDGTFRSQEELRARFTLLLEGTPLDHAAFYCGSGVTAAHNLLALKHAGMGDAKLYAGSWSEWITDPDRPIAK